MSIKIKAFVSIILICMMAGVIGSLFTMPAIPAWYASLHKPDFNPPNWAFGPVWTLLYIMMGASAALVWEKGWKNKNVRLGIKIFVAQLVLNTLWSIAFFGMHSILGALIIIIALWFLILATIAVFYRVSKTAAYLLIPYILWVSFAALLNYYVWILNP